MKHYIYVSDAKVDILAAEIEPSKFERIATELKIDLKVLGIVLRPQRQSELNRPTKLKAVVSHLRERGLLGMVEDQKEYVEGTMSMRWGPYSNLPGLEDQFDAQMVFFAGESGDTLVGLGGSVKHLVGEGSADTRSHSQMPRILAHLAKRSQPESPPPGAGAKGEPETNTPEAKALQSVISAWDELMGPQQRLEFVAKRLLSGEYAGRKVLLGTPLYVAMAE